MVLAMLCAQTVAATSTVTVDAWTDKPWYNPGDSGKLGISMLNGLAIPVEVYNITITYPWGPRYDASSGEWEGNETIKISPPAIMTSSGGKYYTEQDFTIPNDGGATGGTIAITIGTSNGTKTASAHIQVAGTTSSVPMVNAEMLGLNTWMTSLGVIIVICTIILAVVIFLSTRERRVPRMVAPPVAPPVSKAKS